MTIAQPLSLLFLAFFAQGQVVSAPWDKPDQWIQEHENGGKFRKSEDKVMKTSLAEILANPVALRGERRFEFESLLVEISGRKDAEWRKILLDALKDVRSAEDKAEEFERKIYTRDLEVLTALRRLENKPQPLSIDFAPLPQMKWEFPTLPSINISARRHPDESEDFQFTFGGNYRSGRQSRWTIFVWDHMGDLVPRRERSEMDEGGIYNRAALGDRVWETTLSLASFLQTPVRPGRYHGCIAYHDRKKIADENELGGYVLSYSAPFEFEVVPKVIEESKIDDNEILSLVHALPKDGVVKILSATYGDDCFAFIPPESAAGKLLNYGWPITPSLTKHLADPDLSTTQRAWGLGILHSISSLKDPTDKKGLVGDYTKQSGGFWIQNKINGEFSSAGVVFGKTSTSTGGKMDAETQRFFLEEWRDLISKTLETSKKLEPTNITHPVERLQPKPEETGKPASKSAQPSK